MILVTGGTGRFGEQVVRTLRKLGLDVRVLVRKGSHYYWLNDTGCAFFFGDLLDPVSLRRACRDVEYLVVCSGVRNETRAQNHTTVTLEGHGALFQAARERGVRKVVMLSCAGADRDFPVPSFQARRGAEDQLVGSGLDYTILRATVHEHWFLDLAWRLHDRATVWLPPGDNQLQPIASRDLALMAAASLDLSDVANQTIEVGGPDRGSARHFFELACGLVGSDPGDATVLPAPAVAVGRRLGRPMRRYAHRLAERQIWFGEDFTVDADALAQRFGIRLTSLPDAMAQTNELYKVLRDPEAREKRMVHPQFYATVYEPGEADWSDMPEGPAPARD
ncbi:MAG: NAD(P)H-binding protein [Alphaproteobacteria bacterium]|nr:NAD(P)H-binding protein [Alphaproteobacteria bacterium]